MPVLNTQLLLNTACHVCQPSAVLVPETVPLDFVDINDDGEGRSEPVEEKDDCFVSCAQIVCSVASLDCDSRIAGKVAHDTNHIEPNAVASSPKKTSSGSPVFNRQCHFAAPMSASSSPSLFDDEDEKRLHQRNISQNLFTTSGKKITTAMKNICTDMLQPSPSVLSRKLCVHASIYPENEQNRCNLNVDHQQPLMSISQLQSTVNEIGGLQTVNEVKCKDSCDFTVKMKFTGSPNVSEMLHDELDVPVNSASDKVYHTQTLDVNKNNEVTFNTDTLELSATRLHDDQNDLLSEVVKLSQHVTAGDTHSVTCEQSGSVQPLSKKRRCETGNSSIVACVIATSCCINKYTQCPEKKRPPKENAVTCAIYNTIQ